MSSDTRLDLNAANSVPAGSKHYPLESAFLPADSRLLPEVRDEQLGRALLEHMERRITRNPRDLRVQVQRILMLHRAGDSVACFDALTDLFIILGPRGLALRANLLGQVEDLLSQTQVDFLHTHLISGLDATTPLPESIASLLTHGISGKTALFDDKPPAGTPDELVAQALACIDHDDDKQAQRYLEQALEDDPGHAVAVLELLALYQRNGLQGAFRATWTRLSSRKLALPELWAALDNRFRNNPPLTKPQKEKEHREKQMTDHGLLDQYYLLPSPAGAFYAVSSSSPDPMRQLLLALMAAPTTAKTSLQHLAQSIGADNEDSVVELLHQAQTLAWVQGFSEPRSVPTQHIASTMEKLLEPLSAIGKGLLVDWNGFAFARQGIDDETASVLSALATDIAAVERRHAERLRQTLGISSQGWAAVDAYGASRIGAWPLFIANHRFLIVLQGEPRLNQPAFVELVWLLVSRYGGEAID